MYDGVLGMFQKKQIEISVSPFRFTPDRVDLVDFTALTWITTPTIVFRHPPSRLRNIFQQPLTASVWKIIMLLAILVSILTTVSMKYQRGQMSVARAFTMSLGILCQQGIIENSRKTSVRIISYVFILFSLIMYQFYSSYIVSSLLIDTPKTINTLRHLIDSRLEVGIENISYNVDFFQTTNDKLAKELFKKKIEKQHNFFNVSQGLKLMSTCGFAFHVDTSYAYKKIQEVLTEDEVCELHEMLLFPIRPLSVAVSKDSPFREFITIGLQRLIESGIVAHQTKKWSAVKPKCVKSVTKIRAIDFNQAYPIFILLACSSILGFVVLICEIIRSQINKFR